MRKQYYFQPSQNGFYAWDVDKLIEKTKDMTPILIDINTIVGADDVFWYDRGKAPTCKSIAGHIQLMNEINGDFPVILSADGKIMDGRHRILKAMVEGKKEILTVQFDQNPKPDYVDVQEDDLPY